MAHGRVREVDRLICRYFPYNRCNRASGQLVCKRCHLNPGSDRGPVPTGRPGFDREIRGIPVPWLIQRWLASHSRAS